MNETNDAVIAQRLAADIVIAYLNRQDVDARELPQLVRQVWRALLEDAPSTPQAAAELADSMPESIETDSSSTVLTEAGPRPAIPVDRSVTPDYLISLEDGGRYRSLRRHLMAKHGLTPDQYRAKWGLPTDYPMVAPSYAAARSEVAKRSGLGKSLPPAKSQKATRARPIE